ncbi:MAG: outer membrane beta-barrel domain-containing protein [Pseudomonadales bacterium]|nr:outer membrane beta-barrel domain-containing protein [Pseudomonadales bacterium]
MWLTRSVAVLSVLFSFSTTAASANGGVFSGNYDVLEPEIVREELGEATIDAKDFEFGVFGGFLSVEDFGVNPVIGAFLAYHVTEDFFFSAYYGQADTEKTSYEKFSGGVQLLSDDERELSYYNINIAYRLLPGEAFVGSKAAFNTALYFVLGAGNTIFGGDTRFTINAGAGYQFLALDWLSINLDVRDHIFDIDILGETKTTHNLEFTVGVSVFF